MKFDLPRIGLVNVITEIDTSDALPLRYVNLLGFGLQNVAGNLWSGFAGEGKKMAIQLDIELRDRTPNFCPK